MELGVLSVISRARAVAACVATLSCAHGTETAPPNTGQAATTAAASPVVPRTPVTTSEGPMVAPAPAETAESSGGEKSAAPPPAGVEGPISATNASLAVDTEAAHPDLPRGTTVLHIGDSFAGALGIELNREFKEVGVRGILKYETATYIPTWAWGKDLEKYLSKYHPDLVMITLGANELEIADPAQRAPTIRHLVERLAGRPCVWVAPPLWRGARPALLDVIRESCAPCAYLDSSAVVPDLPRARDGIHPAMAARKAWAKAVVEWLAVHRRSTENQPWKLE
jgi:lysophospholipase L1-like esterase